jgi:hypothetical protein
MSKNEKSSEQLFNYKKTYEYKYSVLEEDLELIWNEVLQPYLEYHNEGGILYSLKDSDFMKFRQFYSEISAYDKHLFKKYIEEINS